MSQKTIGILGGMGPEATVDLFMKIIKNTPARKDQDHIRCVVDSNPKIPDRTKYIYGEGEDPRPLLIQGARNLERIGASFIAISCNTAHYFYDEVQAAVKIPVVHIMSEVTDHLSGKVQKAGLLASSATVRTGLYDKALAKAGISLVVPEGSRQDEVMKAIYMVKGGDLESARNTVLQEGTRLVSAGAQVVIAGCTEIPLVLRQGDLEVDVLDATLVLAQACVRLALDGHTFDMD